ncbi:MAG: signal recognition particle-docking protein FtsY [Limnothrix sp.]
MAIFDWFRRKTTDKSSDTPEPAVEEKKVEKKAEEPATTSEATTTEIDYLAWAKTAYKNVQEKKQQESAASETAATPALEPEPQPDIVEDSASIQAVAEDIVQTAVDTVADPEPPELTTTTVEAERIESPEKIESEKIESEAIAAPEPIEAETITAEPIEPPAIIESETIESEPIETVTELEPETIEPETVQPEPTITAEPIESEQIQAETIAPQPVATDSTPEAAPTESEPAQVMPAWMQKSDGLEKLKESAIDTEGLDFDEDFLWSAKVLADQGRDVNDITLEEIEWLKKLREGLGKTRRSLVNQLKAVVGQGPLNEAAVTEIESLLLQADVGVAATDYIIEMLQARLREEALPPEEAIAYLKEILRNILDEPLSKLEHTEFAPKEGVLNIWMLTGVNGAGKTTTIGKLAHLANQSGYSCVIAAADTFRAAAVEQVKVWGDRTGTPVIANPGKNTDPAAVVFDGISAAKSRNAQILLVDTAGRLQNKKNLMDELAKIRRIIDKKAPDANIESLLVLDSTLGQNGLRQAEVFSGAAKLSGVVLTKLDGTARGGVALAVSQQLGLPIRFIGAGEGIEDLRPFSSYEFVEALLD